MTAKQIKKEILARLKDSYTKEEVYEILQNCLKEAKEDESGTYNYYTVLLVMDKFEGGEIN